MKEKDKKILIVDDEALILRTLSDSFKKEGFSVLEANNGKSGLEKALEHKPNLILLDIVMPEMDGMSMLKKLREDEWGKKVPVIILTNLSDSEKVAEAIKSKVYDFLVKADWQIDDVIKKVREKLTN